MSASGSFSISGTDHNSICSYSDDEPLFFQLRANNHHRNHEIADPVESDHDDYLDDVDDATLTIAPSSVPDASRPANYVSNLNSFLQSVTPIVPAQKLRKTNSNEAGIHPVYYYCIGDLWESFQEWSAYGAGVPFMLDGTHRTTQYYVPFLSGMQLYIDPENLNMRNGSLAEESVAESHEPGQQTNLVLDASFASLNLNGRKMKHVSLSENEAGVCGSRGILAFEFMEQERPHTRKPLAAQASALGSQYPELSNYRSCDLSPSSWIGVAWYNSYIEKAKWMGQVVWVIFMTSNFWYLAKYPIYRIPVGPTLEDLEASFLTLHALSTQPGSYNDAVSSTRHANGVDGEGHLSSTIRLPVLGLASYKLKGSIICPCDPQEREEENALLNAATNWLNDLQVLLPDHQFFLNRH